MLPGHSSASIAHPLKRRFPIAAEARSDCCRRLIDSSVSAGMAKVGEPGTSASSVGGVEDREKWVLDVRLGEEGCCDSERLGPGVGTDEKLVGKLD